MRQRRLLRGERPSMLANVPGAVKFADHVPIPIHCAACPGPRTPTGFAMSRLQDLYSRWLTKLSVSRKLMLIYLLDLSAVIVVTTMLLQQQFIAIDFARQEVAGNRYIGAIQEGLVAAVRSPVSPGAPDGPHAATPLEPILLALRRAEQAHADGMFSADANQRLADAYLVWAQAAPAEQAAAVSELVARGRALITRVGNGSNLILDPDLDSYYTMSLVVLRLPELLELVHTVNRRAAITRNEGAVQQKAGSEYLILAGQLQSLRVAIQSDLDEALAAGGPPLIQKLRPDHDRLSRELAELGALLDALAHPVSGQLDATLAALPGVHGRVLDALLPAWSHSGDALDALLSARIDRLYRGMFLRLGGALAMLGLILLMVYAVARHIVVPLRQLTGVADAVRLSGDHSRRADWRSEDEIGQLVVGFNDMLGQLDREREAQKERAAIERAAAAQRTLIEALPVPMVVTACGTDALLHANARGQAWVGVHRTDIWARCLEPEARARLQEELGQDDGITEFDVRWLAGETPVWTVLSARRMQYQGQEAVMAAFAPVDRIQDMERSLDLWGKVFEASNEGILILDGEQCIVAANQAFEEQTGHAQRALQGVHPGPLLDLGDLAAPEGPLWREVAESGGWRGEVHVSRLDGSHYPAWLIVAAVRAADPATDLAATDQPAAAAGVQNYIATFIDITERKRSEERIRFLAEHDALTGLPNRVVYEERLRLALQMAQRSGQKVAVMFMDLDHFKTVNDTLGHHVGDSLLKHVAKALKVAVRAGDTVSRLGGDEFVVVLNGLKDADEVSQIIDRRLLPALGEVHSVEGTSLRISCSIGVTLFPDDGKEADELMRQADTAMYQAKADGRNGVRFFNAEMSARAHTRRSLEADLRQALERDQMMLYWQPRVDASSGRMAGVEGLLRWKHPVRGMVAPDRFIGLAEETGLIVPIGAWVIEEACRQIAQWRTAGVPPFGVSINLSARQLQDDSLNDVVRTSMARHGVEPGTLELELTESMVMDGAARNLQQLHALRELGVSLSIDDFGTGYSSLAYLSRFPIDKLKIDRSFVLDMVKDPTGRAITMAVIGLGHTLGLKVVAEGVEDSDMADLLRGAQCDELQGFLFGRPMPADQLLVWLASQQTTEAAASPAPALMPAGAGIATD